MTRNSKTVSIVGSGLAGCFLALLLAKRGLRVELFERLSENDIIQDATGRSYNLTLYNYAVAFLQSTDLWDTISPHVIRLKGSITHIPNEPPVTFLSNQNKFTCFTINRADMLGILLSEATKHPLITMHYGTSVVSINRYKKTITVQKGGNKNVDTIPTHIVIGADGANSLVRIFLQQGQETTHIQEYAPWCYKQFMLSEKLTEKLGLEKQFEHTWTHKNTFIISHFDKNNNLSALLVYPKTKGQDIFTNKEQIKTFVQTNFPDLQPVISEVTNNLLENPIGNFGTIHTDPWYYKDFMALVGDAAHGFYPFFGQGTSAALGDCMLIAQLIDKHGENWEKIFKLYQQTRKRHMDTLGELSKEAMNKYFRYQKADFTAIYDTLESKLHQLFPKLLYQPLFVSLISDPEHSDDHWKKYLKQRRRTKLLGVALSASILTGIIAFKNKSKKDTTKK